MEGSTSLNPKPYILSPRSALPTPEKPYASLPTSALHAEIPYMEEPTYASVKCYLVLRIGGPRPCRRRRGPGERERRCWSRASFRKT
eukprot:647079-Rhodomonas_salina.1